MHRHRTASFIVCMKQEKRLPYGIESKHSYDGETFVCPPTRAYHYCICKVDQEYLDLSKAPRHSISKLWSLRYCKVVIHTKDKPHLILDYLLQIIVALLRNSAENAEMLP